MSVCALALTVGSLLPAAAEGSHLALLSASSSSTENSSRIEISVADNYDVAVAAAGEKSTIGLSPGAQTAPKSGTDYLTWNAAMPSLAMTQPTINDTPRRIVAPIPAIAAMSPEMRKRENQTASNLSRLAAGLFNRTRILASQLTASAMHFIGTPYVFGGTSVYGFDCSGYVQHVFAMFHIALPRTADAQYLVGQHIERRQMVRGDLVFFTTYTAGVSHVGIYLGHDSFIHSSSHGVQVSNLRENYWASRYVGATHIIGSNVLAAHLVN
jgi:cell wall-associated NlpC family hydrolase